MAAFSHNGEPGSALDRELRGLNCVRCDRLSSDLAARDAELAKMLDEREGNARQFRRIQDRLAQAEVDAKFWMEVSAEQRAELLKIAENPYEGNESALDYSCTHWKQRAEAAEMRLKLYEPIHTFNGLTIEEWKRKAEAAERDAFTMAAGQCIVKSGGLMADDHGHQYCDMERQRDEWKRKAEEAARDADAAAIYGNTGRAHGFVGIPKWSELAEETRNLYREALAARAAIAAKGEA